MRGGILPLLAVTILTPAVVTADEVVLKNGSRISGIVVDRTPAAVTVDVGAGRVTLPLRVVERVVEGTSALATFQQNARQLAPDDLDGWLELGLWAKDHDLLTPAREAFEHVLARDPGHAGARRALGYVRTHGRWMTPEESYRARGYVQLEGRWITPDEHSAELRARAERSAEARARAEGEARVREAEARAREAEARARAAEAETRTASTDGIPVGALAAGGLLVDTGFPCCRTGRFCPHRRPARPEPPPSVAPPPSRPTRSSWGPAPRRPAQRREGLAPESRRDR